MKRMKLAGLGVAVGLVLASAAARESRGAELDVTKFGAVGDGVTVNTAAIQKAVDECAGNGGGVVVVPAAVGEGGGKFVTGTIELKSNVTLRVEEGASLVGSVKAEDYRNLDPFLDGLGQPMGYALVVAVGANHVGIEGKGTIDGRGKEVKAEQSKDGGKYTKRPFLVRWVRCDDVRVRDIHLANSGAWGMHLFHVRNADIEGVTIRSRGLANNDGIDIDSCDRVKIRNCDISTGDDAICLKATSDVVCRDVDVKDCKLSTACNGVKLGTESLGGFEKVRVEGCELVNVGMSGIALYTVDGGDLHDVRIGNVKMETVRVAIALRLGARGKVFREGDKPKTPGRLFDVEIKGVRATKVRQIGVLMNGVPGHVIEDVTLSDVEIEVVGGGSAEDAKVELPEKEAAYPEYSMFGPTMPAFGMYLRHARGVKVEGVKVKVAKEDARPEVVRVDVE